MRAEDRKPSKRVFPLLQNLDLDSVTFSQVQSVGEPISIEDMNEQEMVDLIIVNLARLCVESEWTGLLEAGGSTQYALEPIDASQLTTYNRFVPWGRARTFSDSTSSANMEDKALLTRFVAPLTGTMGDLTLRTNETNTGKDDAKVAIYSTSNGLPGTRIGDISIDVNGGSDLYTSSSWSTSPTITAGSTYWIAFAPEGSTKPKLSGGAQALYLELDITHYPGTGYTTLYNNGGTNYDLPSTITDSEIIASNSFTSPVWSFKYA